MKSKLLTLGAVAAGLLVAVAAVFPGGSVPAMTDTQVAYAASVDYYLKLDGVEGESKNDRHKGEIEILSYSWGLSQGGSLAASVKGGAGAGKASFQDFSFKTTTGKASPKLFLGAVEGTRAAKAVLTSSKPDKNGDYLTITLSDVLISSFKQDGSQSTVPVDQFSLSYSKIEFEYKATKADGSLDAPVKAGYDVKANKKI